jgi:rhodanese-related sulfurtransferase
MQTTETPTIQEFHIDGVRHITPSNALETLEKGEAVLIDVRELSEVRLEKIPLDRVLNHPMSVIMDRLPYITKDQNIILICQSGIRSVKIANLLNRQGYPNVANLEGGITMWKATGLPIESSLPYGGCGCNSGKQFDKGFTPINKGSEDCNVKNTDFKNIRRI